MEKPITCKVCTDFFRAEKKKTGSGLYERYFLEYFSTNEERLFRTFSGNLTALKLKSLSFMTASFFQACSSCEIMLEQESIVNSYPSLLCVKSS